MYNKFTGNTRTNSNQITAGKSRMSVVYGSVHFEGFCLAVNFEVFSHAITADKSQNVVRLIANGERGCGEK